jgi:hypothetical protein
VSDFFDESKQYAWSCLAGAAARCAWCRQQLQVMLLGRRKGWRVRVDCGCGRERRMSALYPARGELVDAMRAGTVRWLGDAKSWHWEDNDG